MVATVLRLRYRVLGNTLARSPWQIVGFCLGILGALWLLFLVGSGVVVLALTQSLEVAGVSLVIAGSALLLGWMLGPILIAGTESTVDADRLAPFPLTRTQVMQCLTVTGLTGIPGIAAAIASLTTVGLWLRAPLAAVVAVPCAAIAVLTCVIASRYAATLASGLGQGRRIAEIVGTVTIVVLMMTGPILVGIMSLLSETADLGVRLSQIAGVLGWTPLGAVWSVPADLALGAGLPAVAKLAIAAATLGTLWMLWARALDASTSSPPRRAASSARGLGLFGRMPTGGVGATWARSLTGWLRDPRYSRQLIILPIMPILFAFTSGVDGPMFRVSALVVAFIMCFVGYADVSYDGTAFASVLSSGIRGRADRLGRQLGAACVGVPLVVVVAVVCAVIAGTLGDLPAVLGGALGVLLTGYGVTAVSSALMVVPVAAPGDNPFKSVPGQTFVSGLLVFVVWAACLVLGAPAIVLSVWSLVTGSATLGVIALAVGLVVGAGVAIAGVVVGGRILDRTGPDLLRRIKAFPTS